MLGRLELLILIALALVGYVLLRLYRRGRRIPHDGETPDDDLAPRCGRCHYIVRGVPTFTCPECGGDLREVGILTPAMRQTAGPVPWVIAWSLALLLIAVPMTKVLAGVLPLWRQVHAQRVIFIQDANLNTTIRATAISHTFGRSQGYQAAAPPPETLTLANDQSRTGNDLVVQFPSGAHRFRSAAGQPVDRPSGFGPATIAEWLDVHGASAGGASPTQLRDRAADVDAAVRELPTAQGKFTRLGQDAQHPLPRVTAHPAVIYARPADWNWAVIALAWLVLWWLGVTRILRRHRRYNRSPGAPHAHNSSGHPAPPVLR